MIKVKKSEMELDLEEAIRSAQEELDLIEEELRDADYDSDYQLMQIQAAECVESIDKYELQLRTLRKAQYN
jgi:hypothetical protein